MITFNIFTNIFFGLITLAIIVVLVVRSSRHAKKREEIHRRFLEEEDAANAVRKKEISPELFYTADLSVFPALPADDPFQIERCAKRTMIYFKEPVSNLELKKQYGAAQMDIIAQYEENFSEYLKSLTKWAGAISDENPAGALKILETVISHGAEFRDSYKLTADIYAKSGDKFGLDSLISRAEKNYFKDPSIRAQILEYINMKKRA